MAKQGANPREPVEPLSRFGVLVAQLESIVACSSQQSPDPLLCFDLLSDLVSVIDEEPKVSILQWQRKCEDALYSLLVLGARRPVRRLASLAMVKVIAKGDGISIYSRASSLQGWLSDGKKSDPLSCAGASQCLGELYRSYGRRITSGLMETANIAAKLMKFHEDFVRQEALQMLQNALEGSGGLGSVAAYAEAYRIIIRVGVGDKSFVVRIAAARCLKTFASIGGPGLGVTEFENSASYCVKALEDPVSSVRDAFAEALGSLLALGMNPEAQLQLRGRTQPAPERKLEGGLQKHLVWPFMRAAGVRSKDLRIGLTLSWVFFLQAIHIKFPNSDSELQNFALQAMGMLHGNSSVDAHALACVLYILRVGVTEQMTEPSQRSFLVILGKQLESPDISPSMEVAALRTLSYLLTTLGEVPMESKEVLESTVVAALSHSSSLVRVEAALTLRTLVEVDPTCLGGLISYSVTTLKALRESVSVGRGDQLNAEVDSLHGQAVVLAAIVSVSPRLVLGYPAWLPKSVFEVSMNMLMDFSRDPFSATVERESGWLLLSSLISSMPKEELEEQVFDILSLWAVPFGGNPESKMKQAKDLNFEIRVWSAAVEALTAFIKSFLSPKIVDSRKGILLQPVLVYLSGALSYISSLTAKELPNLNPSLELFIIRTLVAYQSLGDPLSYKSDHHRLIQICTTPFRDPHRCEESSALRMLLDKRDACLGPWIPGRDWFEDELRAFEGGSDGLLPCVWEIELPSFPQPEPLSKTLVNQMLQCFGIIFATQDTGGKLKLLGLIEQCLKTGKKQPWHASSTTNACVGLLAGLKASLTFRPQALAVDMLNSIQSIFQGILAEGEISMAQQRALAEGLGLLARLGNDIFTARMTRSLLGDLVGASDSSYTGSIALALGCIHRSAGGMALSTLVPATVSSISLLAKSSNATLQAWSLHGLLLTIEAAGLSFVSHVQATLLLAMEILLSEENGQVDIRHGIGRLINAIVAVLGPELVPGSTFFSRCKSVVSEISSGHETSILLECVRFTQQLVLFAPQAVSVHSHIQTLRPTLSSRQPTLRHLAVSTLRHLIEKDPVAIIGEQIEVNLFSMLNGETDSEIGNLVRATIIRLLYMSCPSCPSSWISLCRNVVLATMRENAESHARSEQDNMNGNSENNSRLYHGEDDENMIGSSSNGQTQGSSNKNDKHLRYRTRVFAAECLSHLPVAVGKDPAHFDISIARKRLSTHVTTNDWLVLHIQELVSLAYQISTIQFENMQPIGVRLLCVIADKFGSIPDPELPGHLLMEQYQAQFVSAVRTALEISSGPLLLEAGLQLATKILTSSITSGDRVALQRLFSLISRPLNDFKDMYYPSFAEWVVCKIKIRLLAAHASVKCYAYTYLRRQQNSLVDDYLSLIPLFSKSSTILGKYWIWILKDYCQICFGLHSKSNYEPFLEGIQSALVSSIVRPYLDEAWPVIFQAVSLDSVPTNFEIDRSSRSSGENLSSAAYISGHSMVKLEPREYNFLWGFALFVLFHGQLKGDGRKVLSIVNPSIPILSVDKSQELNLLCLKIDEIALVVFQSLSTERFYNLEMLSLDNCRELLQVLTYPDYMAGSLDIFIIPILSQIVNHCPDNFYESEEFTFAAMELCIKCLYKSFTRIDSKSSDLSSCKDSISALLDIAEAIACRSKIKKHWKLILVLLSISYKCFGGASTDMSSAMTASVQNIMSLLKRKLREKDALNDGANAEIERVLGAWVDALYQISQYTIRSFPMLETKKTNLSKLILEKLYLCLEEAISLARLSWEAQHLGQKNENESVFCFTVYKDCIKCIQIAITDLNIQVQTVGLRVLKSNIQREFNEGAKMEEHSFLLFFIGELCDDIFSLVQKMLKKPVTNESGAIISECLTLLVLLHKLSQASKCQQDILNLLLDATILVASTFSEGHSQELDEVKGIAVRLVSHVAHIPSSAAQFRQVLLAMPVTQRQKLQDIIRASVTQDYSILQTKSTPPPPSLPPETPVLLETSNSREDSQVFASATVGPHIDDLSREEEDDWDTFQSFPAAQQDKTGGEPASVDDSPILEGDNYSEDDFQEFFEAQDIEISDAAEIVLDTEVVVDERQFEGGREREIRSQSDVGSPRFIEKKESEPLATEDLDTGELCIESEDNETRSRSDGDQGSVKEIFSEAKSVPMGEVCAEGAAVNDEKHLADGGGEATGRSQDDGSGRRLVMETE